MFRGYDTPTQWRHDEIIRIRRMEAEIAAMQESIERQKQKAVASEERIQRLKKELGFT